MISLNKKASKYINKLLYLFLFMSSLAVISQENKPVITDFKIADISVSGETVYGAETIITYSGLKKGETIKTEGGTKVSAAIKKLWESNLFSSIEVYVGKTIGNEVYLEIALNDLPELKDIKVVGVKKGKIKEIIEENKLKKGVKVTENLITTTKNYLENKYRKLGFLNAKTIITTTKVSDSVKKTRVNVLVKIDKGSKIKVQKIEFTGAEKISDVKLRRTMKNTKQKNLFRIFKRSKYIEADYSEDLVKIIDKYKEKGYRDARIVSDTLVKNNNNTISLKIDVEEGEKYYYGAVRFLGNTIYSDEQLNQVLKIQKGDTYNGVELEKRIADNSDPDAFDLTNLYQNNGYLFSTITPVEVSTDGNIIDMEIRVTEGKPAYFKNITVSGNDKTNDHAIYRNLRTRPGQLYSKKNIVRTIRELGQLPFFDAQQISPDIKNVNPTDGTLDVEYSVVEKGSSQIELQGGYGGGGFIGTLGLSFNNFAVKDILKKEAYKPFPMGDGQSLALRAQASRFYQTFSFSFTEPWLGGKKPVQFSSSISQTKQFLYNPATRDADKSRNFNITGLTLGIAKKLSVPDDYFVLSQAISFQYYDLNNYNTGLFTFGNGNSNNLAYTVGLSRNNTFNDPIYPIGGSSFSLSAKFSFPYSAVSDVDYTELKNERDAQYDILAQYANSTNPVEVESRNAASERIGEIDQLRFKWLEFYKVKFKGE